MPKFITFIQSSLDNFTQGASAKKLTALLLTLLVVYIHFRFCSPLNAFEFLVADLSAITALLGVSTFESLKKNKNEINPVEPTGN